MLRLSANAIASCGFDYECRDDVVFNDAPASASPETGAGGGDEPPTDTPPDQTDVTDPNAAAASDVVAGEDGDEDADDHADLADLANDPRVKRVLNKNRKLSRRLASAKPTLEQLRAFGVKDLREVVTKAQQWDQVQPTVQSEHFVRWLASQQDQDTAQPARRESADPPAFDDSDFPWDKNDTQTGGAYLHRHFEAVHQERQVVRQVIGDLAKAIKELRNDRQQDAQTRQREQQTQELGVWKSALEAAAAKVPEAVDGVPVRQLFCDAVISAYHIGKAKGRGPTAQQVIDHYLSKALKSKSTQAAASAAAAAAQRIAENNKRLPGRGAFTGGTPTAARDRTNERVSDINARKVRGYIRRG